MPSRAPRPRRRARRAALAFVGLSLLARPGAARSEERFGYKGDVRQEFTTTGRSPSELDPDGQVLGTDALATRLRLGGSFSLRLGERWSVKARGVADATAGHGRRLDQTHVDSDLALRDLYINGSLGPFQLSLGRKIIRWSQGYAFSPAGILDPPRDPADPQDRLGRTLGRDLAQLDTYLGRHTLTAAFSPGGWRDGSSSRDTLLAVRHHVALGRLELAAVAGVRPSGRDVGTLGFSFTIGDRVALHGEVAGSRGSDALLPRSILPGQAATLFGADYLARLREHDRRAFLRYLLGVNYTFGNGLNLIAEYYHTDDGLDAREWAAFTAQSALSRSLLEGGRFPPVFEGRSLPEINLLQAMQFLRGGGVRRNYVFLRASRTQARGRVQATALALADVDDRSFVLVPEVSFQPTKRLGLYLRGSSFSGGP
jgi:hypothetical protein